MAERESGHDQVREADLADESARVRATDPRPARVPQLRTPRAAGVAGILFSILLVASVLLVDFPPAGLSDAEAAAWFREQMTSDLTLVGLYLIPFAGIAFLWFLAVVRDRIWRSEERFYSTVFLGTGLVFIAMVFAGTAVAGSLIAGQRFFHEVLWPSPGLIRSMHALSATLIFVYGGKMAGAFVLVTNTIAFRTRVFSRWVGLIGYAVGLALLFNWGFDFALVTVFPAWVVFLSVYIIVTYERAELEKRKAVSD